MAELTKIGRLAFREEGGMWNAYYALPDTMKGALLIGSIARSAVVDLGRKRAFMDLMREAVGDAIKGATGADAHWKEPESAPEHERAGNT